MSEYSDYKAGPGNEHIIFNKSIILDELYVKWQDEPYEIKYEAPMEESGTFHELGINDLLGSIELIKHLVIALFL